MAAKFPSGLLAPLQHPRCRCVLLPGSPPAQPAATGKSAETPHLEATPHLLGPSGLWHTPDRHVGHPQKLPNYIEQVATGIMRGNPDLDESTSIAYAINAVKRWARGELGWGKRKVTPEVIEASQHALAEWKALRASHSGK